MVVFEFVAHPEGFPRYFIPAGHSLALKLRKACFRLLIVEPSGRVQILGCATQIKTPPNGGV